MSLYKSLIKRAKQALKGHWISAISVTVIVLIFKTAVTSIEGVLLLICEHFGITHFLDENFFTNVNFSAETVLGLVIAVLCALISLSFVAPILIGEIRWQCKLFDKTPVKIRELFHFYKTPRLYFKSVYLILSVFLQRLLWGIIIFLLPLTTFAFSSVLIENKSSVSQGFGIIALVIGTGFFALGILFFFKMYFDFSLASYILAKDENIKVSKAIKISKKTMHKNEGKYLALNLVLLPLFFVIPFYHACHIAFARHFLEEQNQER